MPNKIHLDLSAWEGRPVSHLIQYLSNLKESNGDLTLCANYSNLGQHSYYFIEGVTANA